jgi:hypothetical protein
MVSFFFLRRLAERGEKKKTTPLFFVKNRIIV